MFSALFVEVTTEQDVIGLLGLMVVSGPLRRSFRHYITSELGLSTLDGVSPLAGGTHHAILLMVLGFWYFNDLAVRSTRQIEFGKSELKLLILDWTYIQVTVPSPFSKDSTTLFCLVALRRKYHKSKQKTAGINISFIPQRCE